MKDASLSGWVLNVAEGDFQEEVVDRSQQTPVVIDFWAPWCGPCRSIAPMLEAAAKERAGAFVLAKINVDENQQIAGYFQIEGIPAIRVIDKGQMTNGFDGVVSQEQMNEFISQICPSDADKALQQIIAQESTHPAEAEEAYRKILATDPDHEQFRVFLARVLIGKHENQEAEELLLPVGVIGELGAEAERLRRILEVRKNPTDGGKETELRKQTIAEPNNAQVRYELGSLLAQQERYPEALETLLSAAELDRELARNQVRELMLKIWEIIGVRSELADETRDRLRSMLY